MLVAPISRASVAMGKTLGSATIALLQGMIILVFAPVIGLSLSGWTVLKVLPLMFLLALSLGSFGVLLATRIKSMEAFQVLVQMLMFPMIFLSGVFFPLQGLPTWMDIVVKVNPATYGIDSIRQVMLGLSSDSPTGMILFGHPMSIWNDVGVLAVFATAMILLSMRSLSIQE